MNNSPDKVMLLTLVPPQAESCLQALRCFRRLAQLDFSVLTEAMQSSFLPFYEERVMGPKDRKTRREVIESILRDLRRVLSGAPSSQPYDPSSLTGLPLFAGGLLQSWEERRGCVLGVEHRVLRLPMAQALSKALDVYSRIGMGQVRILMDMVRDHDMGDLQAAKGLLLGDEVAVIRRADELLVALSRELGFPSGASYSLGNPRVKIDAHRAYEVMRVIRKALIVDREPDSKSFPIDREGLVLRYTSDPEPAACVLRV